MYLKKTFIFKTLITVISYNLYLILGYRLYSLIIQFVFYSRVPVVQLYHTICISFQVTGCYSDGCQWNPPASVNECLMYTYTSDLACHDQSWCKKDTQGVCSWESTCLPTPPTTTTGPTTTTAPTPPIPPF